MYLYHFGLRELPFSLSPNPDFFYPSPAHSAALDHLEYGLTQKLGFIMLSGEIGSGKTMLLRRLQSRLGRETEIAIVFNTNISPGELLKLVLLEFELDTDGDKADLLDRLNGYLIERFAAGRNTVLVIDEAQNLSVPALEEVRMLSNLQTETAPLLQIVLAGQPELAERMRSPKLRQLAQRISVNYHLAPLSAEETRQYVQHRLRTAGRDGDGLFDAAALALIHAESGGIPRIINNLCDAALVAGYADGLDTLGEATVREVVEERRKSGCPTGALLSPGRKEAALGNRAAAAAPAAGAEARVADTDVAPEAPAAPVEPAMTVAEPVPEPAPEAVRSAQASAPERPAPPLADEAPQVRRRGRVLGYWTRLGRRISRSLGGA